MTSKITVKAGVPFIDVTTPDPGQLTLTDAAAHVPTDHPMTPTERDQVRDLLAAAIRQCGGTPDRMTIEGFILDLRHVLGL